MGVQGCFENSHTQLDGTARPSLALESLRDAERLEKSERSKVEEVTARALGAMDLGERSELTIPTTRSY